MNSKTLSCIKSYKSEGNDIQLCLSNYTILEAMVSSLSDKDEVYSNPFF